MRVYESCTSRAADRGSIVAHGRMQLVDLRLLLIDLLHGHDVIVAQPAEAIEIERRGLRAGLAHFELRSGLFERCANATIVDAREQIAAPDLLTFAHCELDQLAVDLRPDDDAALGAHSADRADHVGNVLARHCDRTHRNGRGRVRRVGRTREPPPEGDERQHADRDGGQQRSA